MVKKELTTLLTIEMDPELSLAEICQICRITPDYLVELIAYGIIEPKGLHSENWRFDAKHCRRIRTILHLQEDLEVNMPGAALAIELMDQIEALKAQVAMLERYVGR